MVVSGRARSEGKGGRCLLSGRWRSLGLVFLLVGCSSSSLQGAGGTCAVATDCQSGLVCIQSQCSSDLSLITPEAGADATTMMGGDDATTGDDTGSMTDSGGDMDSGQTMTGTDSGNPPVDSGGSPPDDSGGSPPADSGGGD